MLTQANASPPHWLTKVGMPTIELVPAVTASQFEYTLLITTRNAKVAIDAAMPERRITGKPNTSATVAAKVAPISIGTGNG